MWGRNIVHSKRNPWYPDYGCYRDQWHIAPNIRNRMPDYGITLWLWDNVAPRQHPPPIWDQTVVFVIALVRSITYLNSILHKIVNKNIVAACTFSNISQTASKRNESYCDNGCYADNGSNYSYSSYHSFHFAALCAFLLSVHLNSLQHARSPVSYFW